MAAGSIVIDLLMKTGAFSTDIKRAEKEIKQLGDNIKKFATVAGTATLAVATGFAYMAKQAINSMDELDEMAQSLGLTVEQLSTLGKVAKVEGMNLQDFGAVMAKLIKTLGEARSGAEGAGDIFEAMGLDPNSFKDSEDALLQISEKFAGYQDGLEKTALAQELFGKSGASFIAFLNQGADGIKKVGDELNIFGNVSTEAAAQAATFNDSLTKIAVVGGSAMQRFAEGILPAMNNFTQGLIDAFKANEDFRKELEKVVTITAVEWAENFAIGLAHVVDAGIFVARTMMAIGESIAVVINDVNVLIQAASLARKPTGQDVKDFRASLKNRNDTLASANKAYQNLVEQNAAFVTQTMQGAVADARLSRQFPEFGDPGGGPMPVERPDAPNPAAIKAEAEARAKAAKEAEAAAKAAGKEIEKQAEALRGMLDDARKINEQFNDSQKIKLEELKSQDQLATLSKNEREIQEAINGVLKDTTAELQKIVEKRREAAAAGAGAEILKQFDAEMEMLKQSGEAWAALTGEQKRLSVESQMTFSFGWEKAFNQFAEDANNGAQKAGDMLNSVTSNMTTAIDNFVETGKFSFGDFASSIIKDLIKIQLRMQAMKLFEMAAGAIGGAISNVSGGGFGTGNDYGRQDMGQYFADGGFTGAGGKYEPAGIVHRGEYVLNANATKRIGVAALDRMNGYAEGGYVGDTGPAMQSGGGVTVNVINQSSQPVQATQGSPRFDGAKFVQDIILTDLRRNGPIGQALRTA